jgi:hypothetical protein
MRRNGITHDPAFAVDRWHAAAGLRAEWADFGLSTKPADRDAAEAAITGLYRLIGRPAPRFIWVSSPRQATEFVPADAPPIRLRAAEPIDETSPWYVACRLATLVHDLRTSLDRRIGRPPRPSWAPLSQRLALTQPPLEALSSGTGLADLLDVGIRDSLERSVCDGIRRPLRAVLTAAVGEPRGLCWYGQHDVHWVAHYDVRRRLGERMFRDADARQLDLWAATVRSCGWWWPYDGWCVVTERTAVVHTEAAPGALYGEARIHNPRGMAVAYADGTGAYAWHGTPVPAWVITEPTVERIQAERNIEVRRCAIERIGWDAYLNRAGLRMVALAPDPGNPGCELQLYDLPTDVWGAPARVLLTVNGSVERDGSRRRYGLSVPADIDDPVAAAGWSYGLSGAQYAGLLRRT